MENTAMLGIKKETKKGLQIIIVGCGKVGRTLVEQLTQEGHNITIIDRDAQKVQAIANLYDVMGVHGNGASYSLLQEAGIENTDLLIAVTESDELNLLCCTVAKKVGSNLAAIARVRNPDYSDELVYLRQQLGLSMIINPELEAAKEIARILSRPQALSISSFAKGHAELVRFKIPESNVLAGKKVMELDKIFDFGYLVCAVDRDGRVSIPGGQFVLLLTPLLRGYRCYELRA